MKAIYFILGFLLYLNYRVIYFFSFYKGIHSFNDFSVRRDTDNMIKIVLTIDIALICWYFFGVLWCIAILTFVTALNYIVYLIGKRIRE